MNTRIIVAVAAAVGILALPGSSGAEPSKSKEALIQELIEISGVSGMAEQMKMYHGNVELSRIQTQYGPMMELAVSEQTDLSEENRQRLTNRLADWNRFAERFYTLFVERVDFTKIIEVVYQPLYDKYYTADELEEIVIFYRTSVGRKLMVTTPALMGEAGQGVDNAVQPHAVALIKEIFDEAVAELNP